MSITSPKTRLTHQAVYLDRIICYKNSNETSGNSVMAKYISCANHSFTSVEDLNKHLVRDEKVMIDILPQLKKAVLTDTKRGIRVDEEGKFFHLGILIFNDKAA